MSLSAQAQTPTFTAASVVNAASQVAGPIAPGMLVAISGSNLAGDNGKFTSCSGGSSVPTTCNGLSVTVNGNAAPVIYSSPTGLSFQVPSSTTGTSATIQVKRLFSGQTYQSAAVSVPVAATSPGLYSIDGTGTGKAYYLDRAAGGLFGSFSTPVQPGDLVEIYGTGFGIDNPAVPDGNPSPDPPPPAAANVTMSIGNIPATVQFAGREPYDAKPAQPPGSDEIVFTVPSGLGSGAYPVAVTVGGKAANTVTITVMPTITSVTPNPVPLSANPQAITIDGTGFQNGASLTVVVEPELKSTGGPTGPVYLKGSQITFISSTQLSITLPPTGSQPGIWTVVESNPTDNNGNGLVSNTFAFNVAAASNAPTITSVVTTAGNKASQNSNIAPSTWVEVHGANLSQTSMDWSTQDFSKALPTTLAGVSATVNNKAAAIYYVSAAQVNILIPIDSSTGPVPLQLSTPSGNTSIVTPTMQQVSPSFFTLDIAGDVAARHNDATFSLAGPAALSSPGYTFTPAKPGEIVALYATGFGQTTPPISNQLTGTGPLPTPWPTVMIGGIQATVFHADLTAPGLYQLNVIVPLNAPDGALALLATYNGATTESGVTLTVQH